MQFKTLRVGCPNRIIINTGETRSHCKALLGQPNGSLCKADNCAALHMADLLINELRAELYDVLKEKATNEHAESTKASPERDKG